MKCWIIDRHKLVGRRVVVEGRWRTIVATYQFIEGGVILDKCVDGFYSWNLDALRIVA